MKRLLTLFSALCLCCILLGCCYTREQAEIAATTLPVYTFTSALCRGTQLRVTRLITEPVSCLHDYSLRVSQMRTMEAADVLVINGAGLEDFLGESLHNHSKVIDASQGISLLCHEEEHHNDHDHSHKQDPHIWLSPVYAKQMASNICQGLCAQYPAYADTFGSNLNALHKELDTLLNYGQTELSTLSQRQIITFHDGFRYMSEAFDLTILHAIEEESGSEASAAELIELTQLVKSHKMKAIFTEENGSPSAASVIAAETGVSIYKLDMIMTGDSYFDAMYKNIHTLKEALE